MPTASRRELFTAPPAAAEISEARTFEALMWAMARPGEIQRMPASGLAAAGACLLDLETRYHAPDETLDARLAETGARPSVPEAARFFFFSRLDDDALELLRRMPEADPLYPDTAPLIFATARLGSGDPLVISGPGAAPDARIRVDGVPPELWEIRRGAPYPLGWDLLLVDGRNVLGAPRSTRVERAR